MKPEHVPRKLATSEDFLMHWLSNPKVRLGLVVNILYLLSIFTPSSPPTRAHIYDHTNARPTERLRVNGPPEFAPLPASAGPLKAETHYWETSDQLDVYLTRELLLVRRYNHTLLLSPSFSKTVLNPSRPSTVLLHFTAFSYEQNYDRDSSFVITADGALLWHDNPGPSDATTTYAKAFYSASLDSNSNQVVETLGHEIPYDVFAKLIRAREVVFELGPDRFMLTSEQLDALRDMRRFLPSTPPAKSGVDYLPYSNPKRKH